MPRTSFDLIDCSISRTMAILGEPWTALILRDLLMGITRFSALRDHLGISRKVLSERLTNLAERGVITGDAYSTRPARFDYHLTDQGWELADLLLAISAFGDRWLTGPAGPPALIRHRPCAHITESTLACSACGEPLRARDVDVLTQRATADAALAKP